MGTTVPSRTSKLHLIQNLVYQPRRCLVSEDLFEVYTGGTQLTSLRRNMQAERQNTETSKDVDLLNISNRFACEISAPMRQSGSYIFLKNK